MSNWQPIETAPKEWVHEIPPRPPYDFTIRAGRCIKVRGEYKGMLEEFIVHWAQMEGGGFDQTPHWFVFDAEPLDWPATEWRELDDDERRKVYGDKGAA